MGMLSRRNWVTEFIGYVLRRGLSDDPDWAFDTAGEMYPEWSAVDPVVAADSAFNSEATAGTVAPLASYEHLGIKLEPNQPTGTA